MQIKKVHGEPTISGWFATMGDVSPANELTEGVNCDWLVIGGGWMGLHAARRLAELDSQVSVVLVDAERIGNNAAGRCAGFAIDLAHNPRKKNFAEDVEGNKEENHINLEGINYIRLAVEKLGVECDWSPEGKYHSAATDHGIKCLKTFADALDRLDQPYDWIDTDEIYEITGSKHYKKALFAPGTVLLQPAKYMHNAMKVLPENVNVYENTPVVEIQYNHTRHMCRTPNGVVRPKNVLLCNNAYLTKFGFFGNTVIPLYTYGSLTRPLTDAESVKIGSRETFGCIPADSFGTTLRRTADNRLFLRNVYSYARDFKSTIADVEGAKKKHQIAFDRRYPEISSMGYEHSWGGIMALSHNGGMVFGKLADRVYGTAFCNGTGLSRGVAFGKALAEYAMGHNSKTIDILLKRTSPNYGYPELVTELGVRLTTKLRFYQAGQET